MLVLIKKKKKIYKICFITFFPKLFLVNSLKTRILYQICNFFGVHSKLFTTNNQVMPYFVDCVHYERVFFYRCAVPITIKRIIITIITIQSHERGKYYFTLDMKSIVIHYSIKITACMRIDRKN